MLLNIYLQRPAFTIFSLVMLIFLAILPIIAQAHTDRSNYITISSDILNLINVFNENKELSTQEKLVQLDLVKTIKTLDRINHVKEKIEQFSLNLTKVSEKTCQVIEELNASIEANNDFDTSKTLANLSLHLLKSISSHLLDELQVIQGNLAVNYNSRLAFLQIWPPEQEQRTLHFTTLQQMQKIHNRLNSSDIRYGIIYPSLQTLLSIKQFLLLNAYIEQQCKNYLEGNLVLLNTLQKQLDYANFNKIYLEHYLHLLQEAVDSLRLILTEKTALEVGFPNPNEDLRTLTNLLIKLKLDINYRLSRFLANITKNDNLLVQQNIQVKSLLDRTLQSEQKIKELIDLLQGSSLSSRILLQQMIPLINEFKDITNLIATILLKLLDVNQKNNDALFCSDTFFTKLKLKYIGGEISNKVYDALQQVINICHEMLDRLNELLDKLLLMAINLEINLQLLAIVSKILREISSHHIFLVNNNKPMNWEWFKVFTIVLKNLLKEIKLTINNKITWPTVAVIFLTGLPLLLIAGLIRWQLGWLKLYQEKLASEVGQLLNDSQLHTPKAILVNLIRAMPVCLLILASGVILLNMQLNISGLLWTFSKKLALFYLVFNLCLKMLEKDGVIVRHFGIPEVLISSWRRLIVNISLALLPLYFWSVMSELSPHYLMNDVLGQLLILINLLLITVIIWPICYNSWCNSKFHTVYLTTITMLSAVPITLIVLTAIGYYHTTLRLAGRWIETIYLVIFWNILYQTILRCLSVAERRISYKCAIARRQHLVRKTIEGIESQEESTVALKQVNQQTLRITMLVMISLFLGIFWTIWSDLITIFVYLDSIILWHYSSAEASAVVVKSVTMSSLLFAVISSVVCWILIRNLPGLLEVLILSRLKLRLGTSYAIMAILKYIITIVGSMIVFGSLGISWDKLQWLAAALSVGLGFGLQEIFGNFISGLIILFERPVRIGDTVTIGTFSGTVSKIRIRATTITDFDRKEVIIPNKAFVTERLINWSLSDTVTRVVIRLGVAYGSDLDKVKNLLLKVATEHPKVMHDPAPAVFFTAFGSSALDHELRLYVRELRDRSYTVDELNRAIDRMCQENNINIAFNLLEVYLHNKKGDKYIETKRKIQ